MTDYEALTKMLGKNQIEFAEVKNEGETTISLYQGMHGVEGHYGLFFVFKFDIEGRLLSTGIYDEENTCH